MKRNMLTVKEVGAKYGYNIEHVRYLIRHKEISAEDIGHLYLVDEKSVKEYVKYMEGLGNLKYGLRNGRSKTYPKKVKDHESTGKEAKKEGTKEHRTNSIRFNRR